MQFGAFLHASWYCKQKKLKTGGVQRTVSRTSPIWLERVETVFQDGSQVEI
jgi:hypothetical protein